MEERDVFRVIHKHVVRQFPKKCLMCGQRFDTLKKYIRSTESIGNPHSFDSEIDNSHIREPLGGIWFSTCTCGNALAITSEGMRADMLLKLIKWARNESCRKGISVDELLGRLLLLQNKDDFKQ